MEDQRKIKRFQVATFPGIQAKITNLKIETKLITIGLDGCGFFSPHGGIIHSLPRRLFIDFTLTSDKPYQTEVQGNLLYAKPIELNSERFIFYGIEFISSHHALVQPLVEYLEGLYERGEVKAAVG